MPFPTVRSTNAPERFELGDVRLARGKVPECARILKVAVVDDCLAAVDVEDDLGPGRAGDPAGAGGTERVGDLFAEL
jgi:hypothetical protein